MSLLLLQITPTNAMTWDNRYIPWIDQLYTGSDSRDANIQTQCFFLSGGDAYRQEAKSIRDEQVVSFPELWGGLDVAQVGVSMAKAGLGNPLPDDWLWLSELKANMPSSIEGQGATISGYTPIAPHFGIGGSVSFLRMNSFVSVVPDKSAIDKLSLNTPGNQALFQQTLQKMYHSLQINSTSNQQVGVSDVVLYANLFDVHEYKYKFRKLDWGVWAGIVIPSGLKYDPSNLASIPFGGQWGGWAWFIAPRAEFELRDDVIFGIQGRIIQRIDTCCKGRIPVGQEQVLFAPIVGNIRVDQGTTFGVSAYFAFEDIRAGLGAQLQYTVTYHADDEFSGNTGKADVKAKYCNKQYHSSFTQEYLMVKLFYDIAHDKSWNIRPRVYFSWDIPMNHTFGLGFAKTNKVAIGCNVNF